MRKLKGFTLIELLIVVAIIAILAAIAVPNFLEAQVRSKVSRVRADHRSVATALEAYYVDYNTYPAWAAPSTAVDVDNPDLTINVNWGATSDPAADKSPLRSFAINPNPPDTNMFTLTTPVAFLTSYPSDPFMGSRGATTGYYAANFYGWILYSPGPDNDEFASDLNGDVESVYNPFISQPSLTLITGDANDVVNERGAYTYDPSNGTTSEGDVWRVKE